TYDKGKLLIIDVDDLDFVKNKKDLQTIIDKIDQSLEGL
ncbi:deoxynucleoside kinase, partial [Flavobacteriaceae bacterium]|nr:deoxynucleoside kinase [Flavobacteriaceae bacterium]